MTWQDDYPEIAKGMELAAERLKVQFSTGKVHETLSPDEQKARFKAKMEKFRITHPDIYKTFLSVREPDWSALIMPKKPFNE